MMPEQHKLNEQLQHEISLLRRENKALQAQLDKHRNVFKQVHLALGNAAEWTQEPPFGGLGVPQMREEGEKIHNHFRLQRLSEREKEILQYILKGMTSKEIAAHLRISKLTVDTHRKHIQQKLEVGNTVELLKLAMQFDFEPTNR